MAKKTGIPPKLQIWFEARRKYHLTDTQIQMARELGLNPKKFGGYANHRQERWKSPLGEYIEEIYFKKFKKSRPDHKTSLEDQAQEIQLKKADKKEHQRLRPAAAQNEPTPSEER
jgi:hypothetical protein